MNSEAIGRSSKQKNDLDDLRSRIFNTTNEIEFLVESITKNIQAKDEKMIASDLRSIVFKAQFLRGYSCN